MDCCDAWLDLPQQWQLVFLDLDARFFRIHDLKCSNCDARHDGPAGMRSHGNLCGGVFVFCLIRHGRNAVGLRSSSMLCNESCELRPYESRANFTKNVDPWDTVSLCATSMGTGSH